jgi:quinol monooxygenase YgiN
MLAGERGKEKTMKSDGNSMVKVALWVRLEAKPGKETDVESFLTNGLSIVQDEPATTTWYALKLGPSTFGIFDTFPDDAGRQAHLTGRVAALLKAESANLFAKPPSIEKVDVIAAKLAERTSSSNLKSNVNTGIIGGLR